MTLAEAALPGFLFGLANAAHCAGMCGVFAFRAGRPSDDGSPAGRAAPAFRFAAYAAGKAFTYVALGAVAGTLGAAVLASLGGVQAWLGLAAGAVLVAAGIGMLLPRRASPDGGARPFLAAPFVDAVRRARATGSAFLFGAATGALPCGVVYLAALQSATTGSPLRASLSMAAFGAGTVPVLAAAALLGHGVLVRFGPSRLRAAGAALVLAAGLVTSYRAAAPLLADAPPGEAPPCCH